MSESSVITWSQLRSFGEITRALKRVSFREYELMDEVIDCLFVARGILWCGELIVLERTPSYVHLSLRLQVDDLPQMEDQSYDFLVTEQDINLSDDQWTAMLAISAEYAQLVHAYGARCEQIFERRYAGQDLDEPEQQLLAQMAQLEDKYASSQQHSSMALHLAKSALLSEYIGRFFVDGDCEAYWEDIELYEAVDVEMTAISIDALR